MPTRITNSSGREPSLLDHLPQVLPSDVIHHQELGTSFRNEVIGNPGKIRMDKAGQNGSFAAELTGVAFGTPQVLFNCDLNIQA